MTIRCKITNPGRSITPNQIYHVVAVAFNLHTQQVKYNIVNDNRVLAFHEADLFDIEDHNCEVDLVLRKVSEDYYTLLPKMLAYDSFYEDFHNDETNAKEKFKGRFPDLYEKLDK